MSYTKLRKAHKGERGFSNKELAKEHARDFLDPTAKERVNTKDIIRLRPVQIKDTESILQLIRILHRKSPVSHRPLNEDTIREMIRTKDPNHFCHIAVIPQNQQILGFIAGYIADNPIYQERVAQDLAFFVKPSWRGVKLSKRLISCFESWAIKKGCDRVALGILSGNPQAIAAVAKYTKFKRLPAVVMAKDLK